MSHKWVSTKSLPQDAVRGGYEADGTPTYVGRCRHEGIQMPAKVLPSKKVAYVAFKSKEHKKTSYQILVGDGYSWIQESNGNVPPNAVSTGKAKNGDPLYVARGYCSNSLVVGRVNPSIACLYIPFNGQEISLPTYEVLVREPSGFCSIL